MTSQITYEMSGGKKLKVIACVDDRNGMLFNHRRQSRDQAVTEKIQEICQGKILWMNEYSFSLYGNLEGVTVRCDKDFLIQADTGEFALTETEDPVLYSDKTEELILFCWNRTYPAQLFMTLDLSGWKQVEELEFEGNSHKKITLKKLCSIYKKQQKLKQEFKYFSEYDIRYEFLNCGKLCKTA